MQNQEKKHFHNIGAKVLAFAAALALMPALLLSCVAWRVMDDLPYFEQEYTKYAVPETVHMDMTELLRVTEHMMAYLGGETDSLQIEAQIDGVQTPFFSEKEIRHMVDVQELFAKGTILRNVCFVFFVLVAVGLLFSHKTEILLRQLRWGIVVFFALALAFLGLILTDFNRYFTIFHLIFFDNQDWILDPSVDRLINLVPLGFFFDTVLWIVGVFVACNVVLFVGASLLLRHFGKKQIQQS